MARGTTNNPALDAWKAKALQPVRLPSRVWVKVRVPDAEALLRGDAMPTELLDVLRDFATDGVDIEKLDSEGIQRWIAFSRAMAARTVRAVTTEQSDTMEPPKDGWEEQTLTTDDFDDLDVADQQALRLIALRRTTPNTVTVQTLLDDSLLEEAAARRVAEEEAGATVDGQREFREVGPGAEHGDDRADVRPEAVADDGDSRPRRRARGG